MLNDAGLGNLHCDRCEDTGTLFFTDSDGFLWSQECPCMNTRRFIRALGKSGLRDVAKRYTLKNYETRTPAEEYVKQTAEMFIANPGGWYIIFGVPGSGKTHICTAISVELMRRGNTVRYMLWRNDSTRLKGMLKDDPKGYQAEIEKLRSVDVLYIDDFYKGTVTEADINLAFSILNDRYNSAGKKTIISSESDLADITATDEAIGSRIAQRAHGYIVRAPNVNRRFENKRKETR